MKRFLIIFLLIPFLGISQEIEIRYVVNSSNTGNHISYYLPQKNKLKNTTSLSKYSSKRVKAFPGDTIYVISKSDDINATTKAQIYAKGILLAQSEGVGIKPVIAKIVVPEGEDINNSLKPKLVSDKDLINEYEESTIENNPSNTDATKVNTNTSALAYKKKSLRKSTIIGGGIYTSKNNKLADNVGFSADVFLYNWYIGFNIHSYTNADQSLNYIPGRFRYNHDSEMQFNLGYLFYLTHNEYVKIFITPHLYFRHTTELWEDSFSRGSFYRRNPESILASSTKIGFNIKRCVIMFDIGIGIHYDTFNDDLNFVFGDHFGLTLGYEIFNK